MGRNISDVCVYIYTHETPNIDSSGPDSVLSRSHCIFVFPTSVTCSVSSELSSLRSDLFIQTLAEAAVRGTAFLLLLRQGLRAGGCVCRKWASD